MRGQHRVVGFGCTPQDSTVGTTAAGYSTAAATRPGGRVPMVRSGTTSGLSQNVQSTDLLACDKCVLNQVRHMRQLDLALKTWGGRRRGAGRKPRPGRPNVPHRRRDPHVSRCPAHVTLRAISGLQSFRGLLYAPIHRALVAASTPRFRVFQFSVQADHLHLLVEADGPTAFERGVRGLAVRVAKAVNRAIGRRGRVWADRYHARMLQKPREVRNALVYVLNNWRKHVPGARGLDPRSSATWFTGWSSPTKPRAESSPVVAARTWLARVGWRVWGCISIDECPRLERRRRARP